MLVSTFELSKKSELLLVAQELERRFAQHGEVEGRPIRRSQGEHHLLGKGCFAGARRASDQIEGELGHATAEHFIETGHTTGHPIDNHWPP